MTPGSYLIISGALIMATVSFYDLCESTIFGGLHRRSRRQTPEDAAPTPAFAARIAKYSRRNDAPAERVTSNHLPQEIVREQTADLLDDLDAFYAWLVAGGLGGSSPARPAART